MKYYLGQRDAAHLWKCQPNNWLPRRVKMTFEQIFCKKVRDDKFLLGWNPRDGGRLVLSHLGISSLGRFDLFNDNDDQSCFLTAGLATWIFNGGYTSLYFEVTPSKLCEKNTSQLYFSLANTGFFGRFLNFRLSSFRPTTSPTGYTGLVFVRCFLLVLPTTILSTGIRLISGQNRL